MADIEKAITEAYLCVLGRMPDPDGLRDYKRASENMQLSDIDGKLRGSKEYQNAYKLIKDGKTPKHEAYIDYNDQIVWTKTENIKTIISINTNPNVILVSTWEINCGIAIYTRDLLENLNNIMPGMFTVHSLNKNPPGRISGTIVHLQNEIGLMPQPPDVDSKSKVIITWHTIPIDMSGIISAYENKMNVVAHIVASEDAAKPIRSCSNKDVHVINIGSAQIPLIDKQHARQLLNISVSKPVGFVFGFQSINKNYHELKKAANNIGIHLIISGAKNDNEGSNASMPAIISKDVTFINRYLSELEVSLYALASDILLFDYAEQKHYSASAAMHRLIGAGRPVVCSDINHFSELTDGKNCIKFKDVKGLEDCINKALGIDNTKLSKGALEYAELTSWPVVARKHIELYQKYIDFGNRGFNTWGQGVKKSPSERGG